MADETGHHHHDPTFYRSPRDAAAAPPEKLAYVAVFSRPADKPDAIAVLDVDPASDRYASVIGFTELPNLTTSGGMPARAPWTRAAATTTATGVTSSSPGCARRGSMSWTPWMTRRHRRW